MKKRAKDISNQIRGESGRFIADTPNHGKLSFRVPIDVKNEVEQTAGDRLSDWLREAVMEKLNREKTEKAC